jgi:hypothetical protein
MLGAGTGSGHAAELIASFPTFAASQGGKTVNYPAAVFARLYGSAHIAVVGKRRQSLGRTRSVGMVHGALMS